MAKPLLLSAGQGKVQEFVGTANAQVATWSEAGQEWVPGPGVGGSGGGGIIWYLNEATAAASPTTNIPSSTNPSTTPGGTTTVKQLGDTPDASLFTLVSGTLSQASYDIVAGFVTDVGIPGVTSIPAGLWEFNVWAAASGNNTNQTIFRIGVYKYDGTNAPTLIANSDDVYVYDPTTPAQYILSVVIPAATTLLATDRIYIQIEGKATTNNRTLTFYFGDAKPTHVHTTILVPIDLSTDVTGTLPVANGGTGATTLTGYVKADGTNAMTASATIPVADVTGAAPLNSPTFTGTVTIPAGASISGFAPLASPTFTGTPSLPTGTTGVTQSANDGSTKLATTLYADTAASNAKGAPYDVAGEYIGKPPVSTVLMRFVSNRSWTLKSSLVRASCTAFPTGSNAVATISIAGSNLTNGTITWTTSSTVTVGSFTDTTITAGQAVVLTLTTADSGTTFENPFFTLGGVVA
jgi:hypothetical protein